MEYLKKLVKGHSCQSRSCLVKTLIRAGRCSSFCRNPNFLNSSMAKRELSSTLKNLKFMQRGANKEEKAQKEVEVIPDGNFRSITTKKCMVIMEGDPCPGVVKGRMSFQSFNPSIENLNEDSNPRQSDDNDAATCSGDQQGKPSNRENEEPVSLNGSKTNGDLKRKQVEATTETQLPNKSPNIIEGNQGSSTKNSKKKSHKRGKLDFNVLRSPKSQNRTG